MKVLFACGGSGGHVTPALAIAEMLTRQHSEVSIAFVGNENGIERRMVKDVGYPFYPIAIEGLHRSLTFRNFRTLALAAKAPFRARAILKAFSPDLVVGTGGYVSYPMIPAAKKMGIPTALYEPNAVPGLSVRLTEKHADRILLQFEGCASHLKYKERVRVVGAPLRKSFSTQRREEARRRLGLSGSDFVVLCFAGSLGAERISDAAMGAFFPLQERGITMIHATGRRLFDGLKEEFPELCRRRRLLPYINDMACYMAAANVIVCRAGAMTLAELSQVGRAAVLVPSPYVAENHQEKNARLYEDAGGALIIPESRLCAETLFERILFLKENPNLLSAMEKNAASLCDGNAEKRILQALSEIVDF